MCIEVMLHPLLQALLGCFKLKVVWNNIASTWNYILFCERV